MTWCAWKTTTAAYRERKANMANKIVLFGAGVRTAEDVAEIIRLGAEATGSTSGILEAEDPVQKIEELVGALRKAWSSENR